MDCQATVEHTRPPGLRTGVCSGHETVYSLVYIRNRLAPLHAALAAVGAVLARGLQGRAPQCSGIGLDGLFAAVGAENAKRRKISGYFRVLRVDPGCFMIWLRLFGIG